MHITEETADQMVVKRKEKNNWLIFGKITGALFIFAVILYIAVETGELTPTGSAEGSPRALASVFVLPVFTLVVFFYESWQNNKALILDSQTRTAKIVGALNKKISFDRIKAFSLGKTAFNRCPLIEIELEDGSRVGTGISSVDDKLPHIEAILQKLTDRLNRTR
jgi:hypothetical protein